MQTYRVKMNNVKSVGRRFDPDATIGIRFFHICSDSIAGALKLAEQQFVGEWESVTAKKLTDPALKISEMQEYENYEIISAPGSANDTIIFRKNCHKINVILRGGDFSERGTLFWLDLTLMNMIKDMSRYEEVPFLTLWGLEKLSKEVFDIVKEERVPAIFKEKMDIKW